MYITKPIMGWNSWNTFGKEINEQLIIETVDAMIEKGYKDAGYEYVIIDDCWALKERVDGKLVADPELFPHGMKYLADYIHSKGMKFGMYSCAGVMTCAGYPSSYGYEFEDARQFAEWEIDYLKYDFCNFPENADGKNAYLTMAMALRSSGRDIVLAACNWGTDDPAQWMRSHGADTYRSTGDIVDSKASFTDIFKSQFFNVEHNAPGCYNDMDMLIVGMRGKGNVGISGCSTEEYLLHFAMWAFMGSPLIIGGDIRSMADEDREILLNKGLIAINQDEDCRPPFSFVRKVEYLEKESIYRAVKLLSGGRFAIAMFNLGNENEWASRKFFSFDDMGIHSNTDKRVRLTDAVTGEELGIFEGGVYVNTPCNSCRILVGEVVR